MKPQPPTLEECHRRIEQMEIQRETFKARIVELARSKPSWILSNRGTAEKRIAGAIQAAINDHGPITPEWKGSAAKRVWSEIRAMLQPDMDAEAAEAQAELDAMKPEDEVKLSPEEVDRQIEAVVHLINDPELDDPDPMTLEQEVIEHNECAGGDPIPADELKAIVGWLNTIREGGLSDVTLAMMLNDYASELKAVKESLNDTLRAGNKLTVELERRREPEEK